MTNVLYISENTSSNTFFLYDKSFDELINNSIYSSNDRKIVYLFNLILAASTIFLELPTKASPSIRIKGRFRKVYSSSINCL